MDLYGDSYTLTYGDADAGVPTTPTFGTYVPPSRGGYPVAYGHRLWKFYNTRQVGLTVIVPQSGAAYATEWPDQIEMDNARAVYLGAHIYEDVDLDGLPTGDTPPPPPGGGGNTFGYGEGTYGEVPFGG